MKILVLSHMYPNNKNNVYGIFVHEQVKALKELGHDVKVISPTPWAPSLIKNFSSKWKIYSKIPQYQKVEDIDVYYPKKITIPRKILFHKSGELYYRAVNLMIAEIYKEFKFDLINAHTALPDGYAAVKIKKQFTVPVVTTIHGADFQQTILEGEKLKSVIGEVIKNSDKIVTVSDKLKNIGSNIYANNNKFITINNGFNKSKIQHKSDKILSKVYKDKFVILSVGNLIKSKGHDITLAAFKRLLNKHKNLVLVIIGEGNEKNNLVSLAKGLGIESEVHFLGRRSHHEVLRYMNICNLFVLPSWKEAFGVVYIEAMAHGKPVIACKGEGIDGIIKNKINGLLVKPKSIEDLYHNMDFLLGNKKFIKEIGNNAEKTISGYTWELNAINYVKLYESLLY